MSKSRDASVASLVRKDGTESLLLTAADLCFSWGRGPRIGVLKGRKHRYCRWLRRRRAHTVLCSHEETRGPIGTGLTYIRTVFESMRPS